MSDDSKKKIVSFTDGAFKFGCSRSSELHLECGNEFKLISASARDLQNSSPEFVFFGKFLKKSQQLAFTLSREQSNVLRMAIKLF